MPLYDYACDVCQRPSAVFCAIKDYAKNVPRCCGTKMTRVLSAAYAIEDIQPYRSMMTGEWISSRSAHRNHLRQHEVQEVGNEWNASPSRAPPRRELRGDFDPTEQLKAVVPQVLRKLRKQS